MLFLVWYLSGRRSAGRTPTRLQMRNQQSQYNLPEEPTAKTVSAKAQPSIDQKVENAKSLNVLFLYNGHDWDAYAVLGVPAGASLPLVTERYQNLIKEADKGQLEFYQAAYQAILKKI